MRKALVIGAGFGGIAAGLRLLAKGYQVNLIDRCAKPGGRAQVFERNGFRHDAGPTVVTAPRLFEELFELFGESLSDHLVLKALTPWYRYRFHDGRIFNYGGGVSDTLEEIAQFDSRDVPGYLRLLQKSREIYEIGYEQLASQPFDRFGTMLKQVPHLLRLGSYRTVWQFVSKHLRDPHLRQAFSIPPLLVGGNPFDTTSIYSLIHFLERRDGIHFAMGGTGAIVSALTQLFLAQGGSLRMNSTVKGFDFTGGRISRVRLEEGEAIEADLVVSNVDPMHLYRHLIPNQKQKLSARIKRSRSKLSMGLFVLFFGTRRQYADVAHHTIWMGRRYQDLLRDIFHRKHLADDFSIYLHRPTATDPSFAPAGCDSFYALAPVPNQEAGIDWSVEAPKLRDRMVRALGETILPGLTDSICDDFWMTPDDFATRYQSVGGAGFSIAPTLTQSAWFRFHNRAEGPENLFLVGAGTHPGAGLPGVLCSAKLVDRLIPPSGRDVTLNHGVHDEIRYSAAH